MKTNKLGVALTKECCPACTKEMDGAIVMNIRLTEKEAEKVEQMHGQVVGFAENFCDECSEYAKQGIILIGIDEEKTENKNNPWRNGFFVVLKEEAVKRIITEPTLSSVLEKRMCYIGNEMCVELQKMF